MSSAAIIAIAIAVVVVLGAIALVTLARRSDVRGAGALSGETRKRDEAARVAPGRTPSRSPSNRPTTVVRSAPVSSGRRMPPRCRGRRPIPRRSASVGGCSSTAPRSPSPAPASAPSPPPASSPSCGRGRAAASVRRWPSARSTTINEGITTGQGFFYAPSARSWLTHYPSDALPKARGGVPAPPSTPGWPTTASSRCTRSVRTSDAACPSCASSGWFECPCHGSQYNQVGEKKAGPAPRGMDRFAISVDAGGTLSIDTSTVYTGPVIGTNTTGQEAQGPHCITGAGKH